MYIHIKPMPQVACECCNAIRLIAADEHNTPDSGSHKGQGATFQQRNPEQRDQGLRASPVFEAAAFSRGQNDGGVSDGRQEPPVPYHRNRR